MDSKELLAGRNLNFDGLTVERDISGIKNLTILQAHQLYDINISYLFLGWIAAILTILVGLPQLIFIIRTKNVKGISLISFWSFYTSLLFFSLLGLLLISDQLIYTEFVAAIVFGLQMVLVIKYSEFKNHHIKIKKIVSYGLVGLFTVIPFIFMMLHIFRVLGNSLVVNDKYPSELNSFRQFVSIVGPVISMLSFLPQTIQGIKNKELHRLPFTFLVILVTFNALWIISWLLNVGYYHNLWTYAKNQNPVNEALITNLYDSLITFALNTIFQIVGLTIASTQMIFWRLQIKGKKIIWI